MRKWATFRHLSAQLLNEVLEEVELRQIEDLWLRGSESDEHLEFSDLFGIDWTGHVWIFWKILILLMRLSVLRPKPTNFSTINDNKLGFDWRVRFTRESRIYSAV